MSNPKDWAEVAAEAAGDECGREECSTCRKSRTRIADAIRTALAGEWVVVRAAEYYDVLAAAHAAINNGWKAEPLAPQETRT